MDIGDRKMLSAIIQRHMPHLTSSYRFGTDPNCAERRLAAQLRGLGATTVRHPDPSASLEHCELPRGAHAQPAPNPSQQALVEA